MYLHRFLPRVLALVLFCSFLAFAEAQSGWRNDVTNVSIPQRSVSGRVGGTTFALQRATLHRDGILRLMQGPPPYADTEIAIYLPLRAGALSGKTFTARPNLPPRYPLPTIHINTRKPGTGDVPAMQIFNRQYGLKLRFGKRVGNLLTGEIYLCFPGSERNWIAGTFRARM